MHIVGGRDYYDLGMGQGIDKSTVYIREKNRIEVIRLDWRGPASDQVSRGTPYVTVPEFAKKSKRWRWRWREAERLALLSNYSPWPWLFYEVQVIFCGKLYNAIGFKDMSPSYRPGEAHKENWIAWSEKTLQSQLDKLGLTLEKTNNFFNPSPDWINTRIEDIMRPLNAAVAIHNPQWPLEGLDYKNYDKWWIDAPRLGEVQFNQLIDPYTAFQELSMYLGNRARPENPMVDISDKSRIAKHGMDKWSFRKMPAITKS